MTVESRQKLLDVAIRLFAEKGFDGTSVKDLADAADVNVSLISYYFGNKEGLYKTCIKETAQGRLAVAERILQEPNSKEEFRVRLRMAIEEMMTFYSENPNMCTIVHREATMESTLAQDVFENHFIKIFMHFVSFMENAQKKQILKPNLEPRLITGLLYGMMMHFARFEKRNCQFFQVSITDPMIRKTICDNMLEVFLEGCVL